MISLPGDPSHQRLDAQIRLFQDTLEALILEPLPPDVAEGIRPRAERIWLEELAVLTGLPAATGAKRTTLDDVAEPAPTLNFAPSPEGINQLRAAHREARAILTNASSATEALDARRALAVLSAIARSLCGAGLWPAYVAAARASAVRAKR